MILIDTVKKQRYPTLGDWQYDGFGNLRIAVLETGDQKFNFLIAVHELIEAELCKFDGITTEMVDEFDMNWKEDDDPGASEKAPYHRQHVIAELVERVLCNYIGFDWEEYSKRLPKL